jgi:hypothetical protein
MIPYKWVAGESPKELLKTRSCFTVDSSLQRQKDDSKFKEIMTYFLAYDVFLVKLVFVTILF